jgi:hypothetical protein
MLLTDRLFDSQSQFLGQHVTASIIQRNAPSNVWSWEFNIMQRACASASFASWLKDSKILIFTKLESYVCVLVRAGIRQK